MELRLIGSAVMVGMVESFYIVMFLVLHLSWKTHRYRPVAFWLCVILVALSIEGPLNAYPGPYPAGTVLMVLILVGFCHFFLNSTIGWHVFYMGLGMLCLALNDIVWALICGYVLQISFADMRGAYNDVLSVCSKLLLCTWMVPYFIHLRRKWEPTLAPIKGGLSMAAGMVSFFFIFGSGLILVTTKSWYLILYDGVNMLVVLVFYLLLFYLQMHMQQANEETMRQKLQYQKHRLDEEQLAQSRQLYEDLRRQRHDLRNHVTYMSQLLKQQEYEKLHNYMSDLEDESRLT